MASSEGSDVAADSASVTPTLVGFTWTMRENPPRLSGLPGDLWCVRDAFSELMGWPPGSEQWGSFIEAPLPGDMDRLCDHLGLSWCDPERQPEIFEVFLDHPGIAVYAFHMERMSHVMYQPHLRHLCPLPPQYRPIPAELFRIIVDIRQKPGPCLQCLGAL